VQNERIQKLLSLWEENTEALNNRGKGEAAGTHTLLGRKYFETVESFDRGFQEIQKLLGKQPGSQPFAVTERKAQRRPRIGTIKTMPQRTTTY
jgi:hypothetical protein